MTGNGWELTSLSATALAAGIRARRFSAAEALESHLSRIELVNPSVNAIVTLNPRAVEEATAADEALARGSVLGPLHGVPITIKDAFEIAGLRTTSGYERLTGYVPPADAPVVAKLRAAGAVIIGKTNLPPLADDLQTDNAIFGRTNNPWNLDHSPGGSSGGEAAAIAARMSPLGLGSDWGGSIRHPAHCCGIFGLKPTENLVSTAGYGEGLGFPNAVRHMNCVGPMARSVRDLDLALRIIAGPDDRYLETPPITLAPSRAVPLRELRVAWTPELPGARPCREIREGMVRLAGRLEALVARIEEMVPTGFDYDEARRVGSALTHAEFEATTRRAAGQRHGTAGGATGTGAAEPPVTLEDYAAMLAFRDRTAVALDRFLNVWDVFLAPVSLVPAPEHCPMGTPIAVDGVPQPYLHALGGRVELFNFTAHPAVAMPLGVTEAGLPFGYQAIGRRWQDVALLDAAESLALVSGPSRAPPGY